MAVKKVVNTTSPPTKMIRKATCTEGNEEPGSNKYRTAQKQFGDSKKKARKY